MRKWACYPWDLERIEESRSGGWAGFNEVKRAQVVKGTTNPTGPQQHPSAFDSPSLHFPWWPHMPLETRAQGRFFSKKEKREHTQLPGLPGNRLLCKEGCFCLRIQSYALRVASSYPCFEWAVKASRLFEKALIYAALQKQRRAHKALDAKCLLSQLYISPAEEEHTFVKEHISSALEPEAHTQVSFVPSNKPVHLQASLPLALLYELSQNTGNTFPVWWGAILENKPPAQPQISLLTYSLMSFDFTAL